MSTEAKRGGTSEKAVLFVCAAMLIDTMSFGMILPILPRFLSEITGGSLSDAARIGGWLVVTFAGLQFLCGPVVGALSDRYGRRPILLASMAAFAINYTIMGFAESLAVLFVLRALTGIAGATYGPCNAYVADITPPERRAQRFALVGAAFGVGFILGPALGGLIGGWGPRAPFFVAGGMAALNFLFGFFALPESLPVERRRRIDWARANPIGSIGALARRPEVVGIVASLFLFYSAFQVFPATWSFFAALKFGWGPQAMGIALAYSGLLMAVMQGAFTGRIVRAIGEKRAAVLGMTSAAAGMLWNALCREGWQLYVGMTLGGVQGLSGAAMNAIATSRTSADRQGELQGAVASLNGLGAILSPLLLSQTLGFYTGPNAPFFFPGAAFIVAAVIVGAALATFLWSTRNDSKPPSMAATNLSA